MLLNHKYVHTCAVLHDSLTDKILVLLRNKETKSPRTSTLQ